MRIAYIIILRIYVSNFAYPEFYTNFSGFSRFPEAVAIQFHNEPVNFTNSLRSIRYTCVLLTARTIVTSF